MLNADKILIVVFLACVLVYTASYGSWTWKRKNRLGAVMLYLLSAAAFFLPLYVMFRGL